MLILDAERLSGDLLAKRDEAVVPTDSGPIRPSWPHRLAGKGTRPTATP